MTNDKVQMTKGLFIIWHLGFRLWTWWAFGCWNF